MCPLLNMQWNLGNVLYFLSHLIEAYSGEFAVNVFRNIDKQEREMPLILLVDMIYVKLSASFHQSSAPKRKTYAVWVNVTRIEARKLTTRRVTSVATNAAKEVQYYELISTCCGRSRVRATAGSYQRPSEKWYRLSACLARMRLGMILTVQHDCLKGRVVCGSALKRSPGINRKSRVLYHGAGFLSSATRLSMLKKHYNESINQ